MTIWLREIAGWMLLALGLLIFYECYQVLVPAEPPGKILEGAELALIGIIVFRGGIGLLKSALAARVCMPPRGAGDRKPSETRSGIARLWPLRIATKGRQAQVTERKGGVKAP